MKRWWTRNDAAATAMTNSKLAGMVAAAIAVAEELVPESSGTDQSAVMHTQTIDDVQRD